MHAAGSGGTGAEERGTPAAPFARAGWTFGASTGGAGFSAAAGARICPAGKAAGAADAAIVMAVRSAGTAAKAARVLEPATGEIACVIDPTEAKYTPTRRAFMKHEERSSPLWGTAARTLAGAAWLLLAAGVVLAAPSVTTETPPAPSSQPSTAPAPAGAPAGGEGMHAGHSFSDVDRFVKMFEDPARAEWQKPAEVVAALHIRAGSAVADIGSGSGYFSLPFARAVEPGGKVYAVDIEPGMIEHIRRRAESEKASTIEAVLATPDDAKLPPGSSDLVFICDTWHHITDRVAYLRRLKPALRPGGRIVDVDFDKRPLPVGPPPDMKLSRAQVIDEFREAGYVLAAEYTFLPYQYFLIFEAAKQTGPR